jgi:hypothetical protein
MLAVILRASIAIPAVSLVIGRRRRNTNTPTVAAIKRPQCGSRACVVASVVVVAVGRLIENPISRRNYQLHRQQRRRRDRRHTLRPRRRFLPSIRDPNPGGLGADAREVPPLFFASIRQPKSSMRPTPTRATAISRTRTRSCPSGSTKRTGRSRRLVSHQGQQPLHDRLRRRVASRRLRSSHHVCL